MEEQLATQNLALFLAVNEYVNASWLQNNYDQKFFRSN